MIQIYLSFLDKPTISKGIIMKFNKLFKLILLLTPLHCYFLHISALSMYNSQRKSSSSNSYNNSNIESFSQSSSNSLNDVFLQNPKFSTYCLKLKESSPYSLILSNKKSYLKTTGAIVAGIAAQQVANQYVQITRSSSQSLIGSFLVGGCVSAVIMYLWVNNELKTISSYKKSMDHFENQLKNLKQNIEEIKEINEPLLERIADAEKMINEIDSVVANLADKTYTSIQKQEEIIQEMRATRMYIQTELEPTLKKIEENPSSTAEVKKASQSLFQKLLGEKPSSSAHQKTVSCI